MGLKLIFNASQNIFSYLIPSKKIFDRFDPAQLFFSVYLHSIVNNSMFERMFDYFKYFISYVRQNINLTCRSSFDFWVLFNVFYWLWYNLILMLLKHNLF